MNEATINKGEQYLAAKDPILADLFTRQALRPLDERGDYFGSLCRSIIGQQVSVAAARAISNRFEEQTGLQPEKVAVLTEDECKVIGLSHQKAGYLRDLGAHFVENPAVYDHLDTLSDDDVIRDLTSVKGIGVWTAQMFLMFTLARQDIFAPDDVGLQKGFMKLYNIETLPPKRELATIAEAWSPYRSIVSRHLWQLLDNTPAR